MQVCVGTSQGNHVIHPFLVFRGLSCHMNLLFFAERFLVYQKRLQAFMLSLFILFCCLHFDVTRQCYSLTDMVVVCNYVCHIWLFCFICMCCFLFTSVREQATRDFHYSCKHSASPIVFPFHKRPRHSMRVSFSERLVLYHSLRVS